MFALAIVSSTLAGDRLTKEMQLALEKKGVGIKPSFMITRKEIRPSEYQVITLHLLVCISYSGVGEAERLPQHLCVIHGLYG